MFTRILVPLDGGDLGGRALPVAERLADLWDAELVVASFLLAHEDPAAQEEVIAAQTAALHQRPKSIIRPVIFTVADEIADELEDHPQSLVVMATKGRAHITPLLGSVAEEVLAYAKGPVLLIGPEADVGPDWPLGPMLVCTDGSATANAIIPVASDWSSGLDLQPWIVTVGEADTVPPSTAHGAAATKAATLMTAITDQPVEQKVLYERDPAAAIVDHARSMGAGLIALATHGASGLRRIALGSVAIGVVHRAPCPVLVTRP